MRIALVYDAVYPWQKGGGEKTLREVAVRLARRGHEVHCFGMKYWEGPASIVEDGVRFHGVSRAVPLYVRSGRRGLLQPIRFALGLIGALRQPRDARFDVVDCLSFPFFPALALSAFRAAGRRRFPWTITWLEVWGRTYWRQYLGSRLAGDLGSVVERLCASACRRHVAISRLTASRLTELLGVPPERVSVIPRGIDRLAIEACRRDKTEGLVLYAGRLVRHKRLDLVVQGWPLVLRAHPGARLIIAGSGPAEPELRQMVERSGAGASVTIRPPCADARELYALVSQARLLVLPSEREGLGMIALEAMALGTPVVAADHPGSAVREIVRDGVSGRLVAEAGGAAAWGDALAGLLGDRGLIERLSEAAKADAAAYDLDQVVVPAIEAHYERLIAEASS